MSYDPAPPGEPWASHTETHISAVYFAGGLAYKQLKPMQTAFLDHSTVERRAAGIAAEFELNRRVAPDVYLGVQPVVVDSEVVDHLLIMRRLPIARRLASLVDDPLFDEHLRDVARAVAAFHASLEPDESAVSVASVSAERQRWLNNLRELRDLEELGVFDSEDLDAVEDLVIRFLDGRAALFEARAHAGFAREGHGDLLAADIFCLDDGPRILDCLAFDAALRLGDVLADIAFLVMDIERLAGPRAAARLLSWYQQFGNEHHPQSLAHHYIAYRALVRAKVTALRFGQLRHAEERREARALLAQCLDHLERARLRLVLIGGGPGTGKSTLASAIGDITEWSVLNSDEIRKERAGLDPREHALAEPDQGLYQPEITEATYTELIDRAGLLLAHGESVILDASWSKEHHREHARATATTHGASIVELECILDPTVAKERIVRRLASPWTVSDATPAIVDHMAALHDQWPEATPIDTAAGPHHTRAEAMRACLTTTRPAGSSRPRGDAEEDDALTTGSRQGSEEQ